MTDDDLVAYAADTPAKYAAQDANGEWWLHEMKPYILEVNESWDSDGWLTLVSKGKIPAGHDWRKTLKEVEPMTTTPSAPSWPRHPAHKAQEPEFNPTSSSLTDSQARAVAEESGTCSDGTECGKHPIEHFCEDGYCNDCPNQTEVPTRKQMIDRCNRTFAFWPIDAKVANQIMPVELPWRWTQDDDDIVLMNLCRFLFVTEYDWCAGEDLSEPQYNPSDAAFKQPRYQDAHGEDWIDEFARTATMDEFRGAMRFTIGKYNRRIGKKDDELQEVRKMRDYCERWEKYLLAHR